MASEPTAPSNEGSTFAEQLQKKHQEHHNVTVEDVPDEDDHPRAIVSQSENVAPSEKALGKQKAKEPNSNTPQALDTRSEELFPALGSGLKPRTPGPVSPAWGSQKPSAFANGVNGHVNGISNSSPRASTPSLTAPALAGYGRSISIPGKQKESVTFAPSQLLSRDKLKKPIPEIIRDLNKKSKATISMNHGKQGGIAFESSGPSREIVQQALKELAKQIGARQSVKIPVPASARPHIIGKQGAVVQDIIKKSGANVQVPKLDEAGGNGEDDDDLLIDISIEGDPIAAEIARREIEAIVKERTSNVNARLRDIPAEFYPFIAGPFNSSLEALHQGGDVRVKIPPYHSWSTQGPPNLDEQTQRPIFTPHPNSHIQVSGNREDVQRVKADIERQVNALRQQIGIKQLPIEKNRHQFIAGESDSIHNFLERNGCYVIIPQDTEDTEFVTLVGPRGNLDRGEAEVIELAMKMQHQLIDIARLHHKAPNGAQAHARALTDYLRQRQGIAELEKLYDSRIVLPTDSQSPVNWEIYSSDGTTSYKAKSDITNIINAHPPSRFRHIALHPFYHQHLQETLRDQLREEHGVHLVVHDGEEEPNEIVIVYEGVPQIGSHYEIPRQRPSATEIAQFEQGLRQAQQVIEALTNGRKPIESLSVNVPSEYVAKVPKFVHTEQRNLAEGELPVQFVTLGGENFIRGPSDRLTPYVDRIHAFVQSERQDELERGHIMSFAFPQKYANYLIGKRGENINKLREEFDVEIQINDGQVDLKGPPKKAAAAKARILALSKKLDEEATHHLRIQPQYHRELIGSHGSQVNRLQDRYNVRIQFPRSAHNDDDVSVANGSEAGGLRTPRSNQAPDEVIIRGPKKGADAAKEELESLLKYTQENSQTATVSVAQTQLPSLIGTGGREMDNIRQQTGAKIDVPNARDAADASGRVELKIKGSKKQVEDAKRLLQDRARVFDDSTVKIINVDKKHHRAIIGAGGSNLRKMVLAAGGPTGEREQNRVIKVPKADSGETAIRVEGHKAVVDKIVDEIERIVLEKDNQVSDTIEVPPEKHRYLIGPGGETRRKLEAELGVSIDIPKEFIQGPARAQIKITGSPAKIDVAKTHITKMFHVPEVETLQIPRSLHHSIADDGRFFVRLRNDHSVTIDHAGQQPPAKTLGQTAPQNEPLPLITDEVPKDQSHTWSIQEGGPGSDAKGEISWNLRGSPENVAKARALIQKALDSAKTPTATGYLVLSDPSTYRLVIGSGGSQINAIRKETGCKINVPRSQEPGQAIEITGSKDGVGRARDIILDIVQGRE